MQRPPPSHAPASALIDSHPTDVVLVDSILRPWVSRGVRASGSYVHAADLYSAEPADLVRQYRGAVSRAGERAWYFLSPLRTKSPRGRRKARTVAGGAGWWHGEAGPKPVLDPLDGRRKVGYRQSFSFMRRGDDGAPVRTGWIMVEFHLHDDDEEDGVGLGEQLEGLVLCKVYRSPRHPDTAAANDDGHDDESCAPTAVAQDGRRRSVVVIEDEDGSSDAPLVTAAESPGGKIKADDDEGSSAAASRRRHVKNSADDTSVSAAAPTTPVPRKEEEAGAENESSGATTPARGNEEEKKAADDENENSGATTAAAARADEEEKKAADDENEISAATMAAAAARGSEEEKKPADDEDSSASTPETRKRARAADADDEGHGAASARKKTAATGAPATQHLHCPQCGFHLGALQAVVSPSKSSSETEKGIAPAKSSSETEKGIAPADAPRGSLNGRRFRFREGSLAPSLLLRFRNTKQA